LTELLCLHWLAAMVAPILMRKLGRAGFGVLALVPATTAVWTILQAPAVLAGDLPTRHISWIPQLGLDLDFRMDMLGWLMALIVGVVGAVILVYCWAYFGRGASAIGRFGGVFVAFAGAMFGLVTADNTLLMYVFWELTTVFSFLLIGHYHDRQSSRRAAMQAITVTTFGGLAMLAGIVMVGVTDGGSFRLSELVASAAAGTLGAAAPAGYVPVAAVLILLGALSKSAQVPFHFWLPAAMAAPTPVSAYLHAAAMVKAGIYLVARLAPGFADVPGWRPVVVVVGLTTMLLGGYRALSQHDLKLLLAFGTVSQLGFIVVLVGIGERAAALAGLAMLVAHAMFKATLFLVVGVIDHELGTRDLRELSGVGRRMPWLAGFATLAVASMAGLPPMLGYVGKEAALAAFESNPPVLLVVCLGSVMTVAYSLRFWWGAFADKPGVPPSPHTHADPRLQLPVAVLATGSLAAGLVPGLLERFTAPHADTYPGEPGHLALWSGLGVPVVATAAILVLGGLLFAFRDRLHPGRSGDRVTSRVPSADDAFRAMTRGLNVWSADVTARVQTGSLPGYLTVMLLTMVGAVALVVVTGEVPTLVGLRLWDSPLQAGIVVVSCVAAVLVVRSRRRMKAVMLTAFIGYSTALLFALQGAPDLALTQVLVETVTLVVFVLVLRRLPPYFSNRPWRSSRVGRVLVGALVGTSVALIGWIAASARVHEPVTVHYPDEVLTFGYGRNIVNVTLVDTRAWDTIGEISVLLAAATGVASLVFLRERGRIADPRSAFAAALFKHAVWGGDRSHPGALGEPVRVHRPGEASEPGGRGRTWLSASGTLAPVRRSLIFEIGTRMIFHPLLLFSLFLLLSGHNNPGGGFAGGILAGIALIIRYLAGGRFELALAARVRPGLLLGLGMAVATTAALVPVAFGGTILQTTVFDLVLPVFHEVHLATALFFDIGVYLVVVGLVLDILTSLGAELDRRAEASGSSVPEVAHDDRRPAREEVELVAGMRRGEAGPRRDDQEVTP